MNGLRQKTSLTEVQKQLNCLLKMIRRVDFLEFTGDSPNANGRLSNKDFQVVVIDKLLQFAKENDWGLCRKDAFIYIYNGQFWNLVDHTDFKTFLGKAAYKMGVRMIDAKHYAYQNELYKQFLTAANLPTYVKDRDTVLINLRNGTYEIKAGVGIVRDFERDDFITYQLPFEYNALAPAPIFHKYLNIVLPDKKLQEVLAEFLGYLFTRHLKLEKCLLLHGFGANGKSVFYEIVNALLGKDNVSNFSLGNLGEEHNRAFIVNKLLNYGSEIRGNIESDVFKQLVSGESIQCRLLYGQSFFIDDYARLCFNCNELPKQVEHTEAFFRRFLIVPFAVTIPEKDRDPELARSIIECELSGVFNWVLGGLTRLTNSGRFTDSEIVKQTLENYKKESDSVYLFLSEEQYKKSIKETHLLKYIYIAYTEFCKNDGYRPVHKANFRKRLESFGYDVHRKNKGITVYMEKDDVL